MGRQETSEQVTRVEHMTVHATCVQKKICKSGGGALGRIHEHKRELSAKKTQE